MLPSEKKSLLFAIEDIAKLLRTEVKKGEPKPKTKKRTTTRLKSAATPNFVNAVEQLAKMLRTQVHKAELKKKRGWSIVKKAAKEKS